MTNEELLAITQTILEGRAPTSNSYTWDPEKSYAAGRVARRETLRDSRADIALQMYDTYANSEANRTAFLWTLAGNNIEVTS